jgi:hypothetical protein
MSLWAVLKGGCRLVHVLSAMGYWRCSNLPVAKILEPIRSVGTGAGVVDAVVDLFPQYFEGNGWTPISCHVLVVGVEVCGFDLPVHGVEVIYELESSGVWIGGMLVSSQAQVRSTSPLLRPACGEQRPACGEQCVCTVITLKV